MLPESLSPLPADDDPHWRPREVADTGVKFASWGETTDRLYTGSSDGVVKSWNVKRAAEDVLVRNVVQLEAGVMSGSFSPDLTQLLIGDAVGGVNLLSAVALNSGDDGLLRPFDFHPADSLDRDEGQATANTS